MNAETGKKEKLARLIYASGGYRCTRLLRALLPRDLKILAYHRICEIDDLNDPELVSATRPDFEWQIDHLRRYYHPITFAEVIDRATRGRALPGNAVIVTFDDGFADNYINAYPVLRERGVPATFFVSTGYIGEQRSFWFNELARMIRSSPGKSLVLDAQTYEIHTDSEQRLRLVERLLQRCKDVGDAQRRAYIDSIASQLDYRGDCDPLARPLSWEQVVEMSRNGMEFGSHTVDHPILSRLAGAPLRRELVDSKQMLEARLGQPIQVLSYPDGGKDAVTPEVLTEVRQAGYRLGVSYISGNNRAVGIGDMMLRRIHVEHYTSRERFAAALALPEILG